MVSLIKIGEGSFGDVFIDYGNNNTIVKVFYKEKERDKEFEITNEISNLFKKTDVMDSFPTNLEKVSNDILKTRLGRDNLYGIRTDYGGLPLDYIPIDDSERRKYYKHFIKQIFK